MAKYDSNKWDEKGRPKTDYIQPYEGKIEVNANANGDNFDLTIKMENVDKGYIAAMEGMVFCFLLETENLQKDQRLLPYFYLLNTPLFDLWHKINAEIKAKVIPNYPGIDHQIKQPRKSLELL